MAKMTALSASDVKAALATLPRWTHADGALRRELQFKSHREAMSFLVRISYEAEQRGHHPEIFNVYNKVVLVLRTHDAGNVVTTLDVELATAIESIVWI